MSDGCLVADVSVDEPVWATLVLTPGETPPSLRTAAPAAVHELGTPLGLPGRRLGPAVNLVDLAGNETVVDLEPLLAPAAPDWAITEILANPAGKEPAQEWVELLRLGSEPGNLAGLRLGDGTGQDPLPDLPVAPGERVVVVGHAYDAAAPRDTPAAPGTRLARLAGTIGSCGLANGGEPVELRDATGAVVSAVARPWDTAGAAWAGRSVERVRPGGCDVSANMSPNEAGAATPGLPNSVEQAVAR